MVNVTDYAVQNLILESWTWLRKEEKPVHRGAIPSSTCPRQSFDVLKPLRQFIDRIEVKNPQLAHRICKLIPAHCPFERDVRFMGRTLFHIPPMCKFNPLYDQVVGLRFRALCYLADVCGEDVTRYC